MPIGKPILRVAKMKRNGPTCPQAVDNHLSRTVPTANANSAATPLNEWLVGAPGGLAAAIDTVLDRFGINRASLRQDATIANDVLLTISPQWFRPEDPDGAGSWDPARLDTFRREAEAFLREQFGTRLVAAVLHLDESTPHVQAVIVPIIKRPDGAARLSGRDLFNPARLHALQDAWQTRLEPHGVGPREVGSTARHRTIKSYYSALQSAPEVPEPLPPSPPPLKALMPGGADAMAQWQADEVIKIRKRTKPLAAAAAKGMLYEAEKHSGDVQRELIGDHARRLAQLRTDLAQASEALALTKAEITRLRGVPVHEVAAALGYTGELGKRENSIDLLKRIGGLSFEDATRWLSVAFSNAAAGAAVVQHIAAMPLDVHQAPLTRADQVKALVVRKQLDALGAPGYRITIMHNRPDGTRYGMNLCRPEEGQPERLWGKNEVLFNIPYLTAQNARGGHVFITPVDPSVHHALIDDLSVADLARFKSMGYAPAAVMETSANNHQVVVKVARDVPTAAVNEWFKAMNRELGDDHITGLSHPMRLVGFQNRKAKHEQAGGLFPFVRLVEAASGLCGHARAVISSMARQMRLVVSLRDETTTLQR